MKRFILKALSFVMFFVGFLLLICEPTSDTAWFQTFFISKSLALVSFCIAFICGYASEKENR